MKHIKQKLVKFLQKFEGFGGERIGEPGSNLNIDILQNKSSANSALYPDYETTKRGNSDDILIKLNKLSVDFDLESIKNLNKNIVNECLIDFNIYLKMLIHELRTPLSTISIGLDILEFECQNITTRQTIDDLKQNVIFIENIFTNFAVIKNGKIELNLFIPFSLDDMLRKISVLLQFHINKENVSFKFIINPEVYDWNYGDVHNLKHCIINLMKNSIKYRELSRQSVISIIIEKVENKLPIKPKPPESVVNSIRRRSQISLRSTKNIQIISIKIRDNNNHILQNIKEKLFEPFNSTSGSGLGLYICKSIIDLYGGTIIHNFIEPTGNEFVITFPSELCENEGLQLLMSLNNKVPEDEKNLEKNNVISKLEEEKNIEFFVDEKENFNILLVDDSIFNTRMMYKILNNMKFFNNIYTALDGYDAIEKMSNNLLNINIIFLDKYMPNLDGINTAKKLRELYYNNLIFGVTGDDNTAEINHFLHSGADYVLIKPLYINKINMIIKFIKINGAVRRKNCIITYINDELQWMEIESCKIE